MKFDVLTDEQIAKQLGEQFEALRLHKRIQDAEIQANGGVGRDAIDKLRNHRGAITLTSFIKILRGLGELERLESLLALHSEYVPSQTTAKPIKRVSKKRAVSDAPFVWGDES